MPIPEDTRKPAFRRGLAAALLAASLPSQGLGAPAGSAPTPRPPDHAPEEAASGAAAAFGNADSDPDVKGARVRVSGEAGRPAKGKHLPGKAPAR